MEGSKGAVATAETALAVLEAHLSVIEAHLAESVCLEQCQC